MSELLMVGIFAFVLGLAVGKWITRKAFLLDLKYKARTGIDLNEDGTFYTIIYSERNK